MWRQQGAVGATATTTPTSGIFGLYRHRGLAVLCSGYSEPRTIPPKRNTIAVRSIYLSGASVEAHCTASLIVDVVKTKVVRSLRSETKAKTESVPGLKIKIKQQK